MDEPAWAGFCRSLVRYAVQLSMIFLLENSQLSKDSQQIEHNEKPFEGLQRHLRGLFEHRPLYLFLISSSAWLAA